MAEQRQLPRVLAATHARFHTPHIAIVASAACMLALTLSGSFLTAVAISTLTRLLAYAATCAALPVLRRRDDARGDSGIASASFPRPRWHRHRRRRTRRHRLATRNGSAREVRDVAIAMALGICVPLPRTAARSKDPDCSS